MLKFKKGLPIIKAKIYLIDGLVVFSSAPAEIGGNRRTSHFMESQIKDFDAVIATGRPLSRQVKRSAMNTRQGVRNNVEVVSSYIPIFGDTDNIQGVVEVYSDITGEFALARKQSYFVAGLVIAAFSATYLFMLLVVVRADRTIKCQYKKLEAFNETLEMRVSERSAAAETAANEARMTANALSCEVKQRERAEDELRHQNLRLDVALQNMSHGLAMFDAQHRLVLCNDRYAEIYGIPAKLRAYGTLRREIIEHRIKCGISKVGGVEPSTDADIENLLGRMIEDESARIDELADGRIISIKHHPT